MNTKPYPNKSFSHPVTVVHFDLPRRRETKQIQKVLKELQKHRKSCPNCGGLLPEISFYMAGKQFYFVCYRIEDCERTIWDGEKEIHTPTKVLATTDYAKLGSYCEKIEAST